MDSQHPKCNCYIRRERPCVREDFPASKLLGLVKVENFENRKRLWRTRCPNYRRLSTRNSLAFAACDNSEKTSDLEVISYRY